MILLASLVVAAALAAALGGKLSRLVEVDLRAGGLVLGALAVQGAIFSPAGAVLPAALHGALHVASYALLGGFFVVNRQVLGLAPIALGMVANATAIVANGGRMPLSPGAADAAGIEPAAHSNVSVSADRLAFLGDVFALPAGWPLATAFSAGDILIALGTVAFVVLTALGDREAAPLDLRRLVEPLAFPAYRRLAAGRLVSTAGDWLSLAALVGWVYGETGSLGGVVVLMLARLAPPVLGGGVAALVVDRLPKGRLLVWVELARAAAVAATLAGVVAGSRGLVLAAFACSGALVALSNAAAAALVPALLPAERLPAANAGLALATDAAMAVGALAAGAALALVGAPAALLADLVTFAVAAVLYRGLRLSGRPAPRAPGERLADGVRYLLGRRRLLLLVLAFGTATVATGLVNASLAGFLAERGLGDGGYGFGIAALAAGLAAGEAIVGLTALAPGAARWVGGGLLGMSLVLVALAATEHVPSVLLFLAVVGLLDGTTDVVFTTVVQRETEERRRGAVFGFSGTLMSATMMGAFACAPLLERLVGTAGVVVVASAFLALGGAIGLLAARRPALAQPAPAPA